MHNDDLRRVLDHDGPFTSVHLDCTHDSENAAKELVLRRRSVRQQLAEQGADDQTCDAIDEAIRTGPPPVGRAGRLLVAAGGEVLLDRFLGDPPPLPVVRVGRSPYLVPYIGSGNRSMPHVVALVDRVGADLRVVDADGGQAEYGTAGREHPVHKVRGGGLSHHDMQRRTEEAVHRNLSGAAEEIRVLVDRVGARLLVLAGDVQARAELRNALPIRSLGILVESSVGRRETGWSAELEQEVHRIVADRCQAEHDQVIERLLAELNTDDGLAVQGLEDAAAALREANAEAVVVAGPALADTEVWTSREPDSIALTEAELRGVGAAEVNRERADEAVPAAAVRSGADVVAEDESPVRLADGVGVLLRHR
jgi:hypothetical protein